MNPPFWGYEFGKSDKAFCFEEFFGAVDVGIAEAFVGVFDLAGLVVVRVKTHEGLRRIELTLEFGAADIAVRIEIAEIPVPRFVIAVAFCTAAVPRIVMSV